MTEQILFVDDEIRVLDGIRRLLRNRFDISCAEGGRAGLGALEHHEFAVIVSDMMMPDIGGPAFLAKAAERQPDSVQMILSGQADLHSTVAAVNDGNVYRFLLKPIERDALCAALTAALEQFHLRRVEQDLLRETLAGAVDALGEVVAMASPHATKRHGVMRVFADRAAEAAGLADDWQMQLATMLANVGCVAVPAEVLDRSNNGRDLTRAEHEMLHRHPRVASDLLSRIPRLDGVAEVIAAQYGTAEVRPDMLEHAQVLQLAAELADRKLRGIPDLQAIELAQQSGRYPAHLVSAMLAVDEAEPLRLAEVGADELRSGMVLQNDLCTLKGAIVANAGTTLTPAVVERIHNFAAGTGVQQPIVVGLPTRACT